MKKNIAAICNNSICVGCGACVGACPVTCIEMHRNIAGFLRAFIDENKCINCQKCIQVCPQITQSETKTESYKETGYIAYAVDPEIRSQAQSGGVVTALLKYLLDYKRIEGAVVNSYNIKKHINEPRYVENVNDLMKSVGSFYSQSDVCKTIYENKDKKLAAVLLGCQAKSITMAEEKDIVKNISFKIGLICESQYSSLMMEDLIKRAKVSLTEVTYFRWRDKKQEGWPGNVVIKTDNKDVMLKSRERVRLKDIYKNYGCSLCQDKMNMNSDIVCGDPWGIPIQNLKKGYCCAIVRTKRGHELLMNAEKHGYIHLKQIDPQIIAEGQKVNENYYIKKNQILATAKKKWKCLPYLIESPEQEECLVTVKDIKQLEYQKKLYECSCIKEVTRLLRWKKLSLKIDDLKNVPKKVYLKLKLQKDGRI